MPHRALEDFRLAYDRVAFAESVGLDELDPWQVDALRSEHPRMLFNCARQTGKSSVAGLIATHKALYEPGSLVLLLSPALRQSQEVFKKCLRFYRAADRPVEPASETALTLTLENGSRIISLPGKSDDVIRGYTADLLLLDEASRISDALYAATRPMLSVSGGRLLALSTPWGRRGWWFDAWQSELEGWKRYIVRADECPRIPPVFLEQERRTLPRRVFRQEYECSFEETEDAVFAFEDVEAALSDEVTPLFEEAS